jgi:hypothetical protein
MDEIRIDASPRLLSRLCGVNYVVIIILGMFVELFARGRIVVAGNASATTANLRAMETLWRVGVAAELVMVLCAVFSATLLYVLLRPVSRDLALLATFFSLVAAAVEAAHSLKLLEALFPLGSAGYLGAFTPGQLDAIASLAMKSHASGYGMALLLFGPLFLVRGYLILKSVYLPRALGLLYQLSGVSYLALGFGLILAPRFTSRNFMAITLPAFIGEASLALWLLVKGVDMEAWEQWRARGSKSREAT